MSWTMTLVAALSAWLQTAPGPVAIQGAVDTELGPLIEALGDPEPRDVRGFRFWEGELDGMPVVVSRTEVGMVNASVATMILLREYGPRAILNQGTAGAVDPELDPGDIVLGRQSAPFGAFRTGPRPRGEGVRIEDWEVLPRLLREGGERVRYERFDADPGLLSLARSLPYEGGRLVEGVVGSADQWNREVDKLLWAHDTFGIVSEDMESAAVHQVAHLYGVPFLAIRIISNSEHHAPEFQVALGSESARFAVRLARALARQPIEAR